MPLLLDNQELNVFKNTKEDVKKYIYDELDYCIANLPAIRPNESEHPGAVTKYTAEMLKAKQKMYDNEWDEVLALTEDISIAESLSCIMTSMSCLRFRENCVMSLC